MNSSACTLILLDMQLYKYLDLLYVRQKNDNSQCNSVLPDNFCCPQTTHASHLPAFAARIYPRLVGMRVQKGHLYCNVSAGELGCWIYRFLSPSQSITGAVIGRDITSRSWFSVWWRRTSAVSRLTNALFPHGTRPTNFESRDGRNRYGIADLSSVASREACIPSRAPPASLSYPDFPENHIEISATYRRCVLL